MFTSSSCFAMSDHNVIVLGTRLPMPRLRQCGAQPSRALSVRSPHEPGPSNRQVDRLTSSLRHAVSRRSSRQRKPQQIFALFTGIVQGQGEVVRVHQQQDFRSIDIQFPSSSMAGIQIGASVAINGTCLTVTAINGDRLSFDIIVETLRATNLGTLDLGSRVNFERSARVGDEIGGHNVSGHVFATAIVSAIENSENNRRIIIKVPQQYMKYILPKGFIAVDGISLTVGEVGDNWFTVYLIPETLRVTTLGVRAVGDAVNLEVEAQTQAIVDTVENVVARYMRQVQLSAT